MATLLVLEVIILQRIFEPMIHIIYLTIVILMGSYMIRYSVGNKFHKIFGSLALTLGLGDGIYLIARMYAVLTTGIENNLKVIGWGRVGNTIIITIFFLILYDAYNERYSKPINKSLNNAFYGLAIVRIILSILPGNKWFELVPSSIYALIRFVPLALMGVLLILIMYLHSIKFKDPMFKLICIFTFFAILFMEPLIFFPKAPIGVLVLTVFRTISLVSILLIGYKDLRDINVLSRY